MKLHKTYIIIEIHTNKIIHQTADKFESMKVFDILKKANANISAQCIYQQKGETTMKKITIILIAAIILFTVMPSQADAATKYVKVKKSTYQKYKKAYKNQASLKLTISDQKAQITELNKTIKDKKSTISWLWGTLEDFGYTYNYDSHKWESTSPKITITEATLEIEQRGFILISFDNKTINSSCGYYVYSDSLTFDPETQTYSGEKVHGRPYIEFYEGVDYDAVADYNEGHQMYLDYINK